jgi:hypothetical protein
MGLSCLPDRNELFCLRPHALATRISCYTELVLKNVTITLSEEVAHWARKKAAEENTSVSRLVGKMLEAQMRQSDEYWEAYRQWKELPLLDLDADSRLSREAAHERR